MTAAAQQKLARLCDRIAQDERRVAPGDGRAFLIAVLRYRLGLKGTRPHLPARGRSNDVVRWERTIIERRADEALERQDVRDEIESVGAVVR